MSVNIHETQPRHAESSVRVLPAARITAWRGRAAVAVFAPVVVGLLALLSHGYLPNGQHLALSEVSDVPWWRQAYPVLLEGIVAASLLAAAAQAIWRGFRPWVCHHAPLVAGAVGVLGVWELVTLKLGWMRLPFFPGPAMVLDGLLEDRVLLLDSALHSLQLLLSGYALGVATGLVSGVLMGWYRNVRYWGMPLLKLLGPIPATALIPLAMSLFPSSFVSGTALIALAVWFPVTMLTASGIANVPVSYFDVARTLGAGRSYLIFRVAVPAALPSIFIGLFMGLLTSFLTLIVAETVGVKAGLGYYLEWQRGYAEYGKVYAAVVIMAVFFSTIITVVFKVRDRLLAWQKGTIRW
ncbi:MAG TPA: ABC transporter permease [Gemmataceae bacterium]|nr:ABC transporter permease [Gemmataceae bacterium]